MSAPEPSRCFRACCASADVPLSVPKAAFAQRLLPVHDGPASAVFLGRFNDRAVAIKRPKLPTRVRLLRLLPPAASRA